MTTESETQPQFIQLVCEECGKKSLLLSPLLAGTKYICKSCLISKKGLRYGHKRTDKMLPRGKVQYTCRNCGELSTLQTPNFFYAHNDEYLCQKCAVRLAHFKRIKSLNFPDKVQYACIDCGVLSKPKYSWQYTKDEKEFRCHHCAIVHINQERAGLPRISKKKAGYNHGENIR